jgi:hypothetical protein
MNKRAYRIVIQWPSGRYSLLWSREANEATLADAQKVLKKAIKGWSNSGQNEGRKIFICSPKRAKRLGAN